MDFTDVSNKYQALAPTIETHVKAIEKIITTTGEPLEGNSFYYHNSLTRFEQLLTKQINLFWAGSQAKRRVLEIGFNAGHSALLFLMAGGEAKEYTFFDLGAHSYIRPCLEYVRKQFSAVEIKYIEGDSTRTLPAFVAENIDKKGTYDLVHVDGGHDRDVVLSDIFSAIDLVAPDGLMILDDTNIDYISEIADACVRSGAFVEEKILDTVGYQHRILRRVQPTS
jgi:predicted O-methyltransferase YrrM